MAEVINRIAWLEKQISQVNEFIKKDTASCEDSGRISNSNKLSLQSHESLLSSYQAELRQERELLRKEVLNFRLIGDSVNKGTLPLGMLAKLADSLNKTIHHAAYFIRHGTNPMKGLNQETVDQVDLRLSGLLLGSCNLQITGNVADDLAEDSLLGDAYQRIFSILSEETKVSFAEIAPTIGNKAVHSLDKLLGDIQSGNVALELKWDAPNGKEFRWGGSQQAIIDARLKLEKIKTLDPVTMDITGAITDLSDKGFLKIMESESPKPIKIEFTDDLAGSVELLTLKDIVNANVTRRSTLDEVTGEEKHTYHLGSIKLIQ